MGKEILEPIHGIDLKTYVAISKKLMAGINEEKILQAMSLDKSTWDEINTLWVQRMTQDETFELITLFGQYNADESTHPNLEGLTAETSQEGADNLALLKSDRYFYEELAAAKDAAYEYGIDGVQWIKDNFGINLADFQTVAMQYTDNRDINNSEEMLHYAQYHDEKKEEYAQHFAAMQGGNIADDVEF
ncbi:MAG: hypothetical protein LBQ28_01630 [Prevotellaceae bacterium]|jgi:hypothetical protein|nr:hypothetical protein [Prevotellaceae bacterium]